MAFIAGMSLTSVVMRPCCELYCKEEKKIPWFVGQTRLGLADNCLVLPANGLQGHLLAFTDSSRKKIYLLHCFVPWVIVSLLPNFINN